VVAVSFFIFLFAVGSRTTSVSFLFAPPFLPEFGTLPPPFYLFLSLPGPNPDQQSYYSSRGSAMIAVFYFPFVSHDKIDFLRFKLAAALYFRSSRLLGAPPSFSLNGKLFALFIRYLKLPPFWRILNGPSFGDRAYLPFFSILHSRNVLSVHSRLGRWRVSFFPFFVRDDHNRRFFLPTSKPFTT